MGEMAGWRARGSLSRVRGGGNGSISEIPVEHASLLLFFLRIRDIDRSACPNELREHTDHRSVCHGVPSGVARRRRRSRVLAVRCRQQLSARIHEYRRRLCSLVLLRARTRVHLCRAEHYAQRYRYLRFHAEYLGVSLVRHARHGTVDNDRNRCHHEPGFGLQLGQRLEG